LDRVGPVAFMEQSVGPEPAIKEDT
jgi:hypothetical protein